MKIAVAGTGYVGLSMATLLAQHHSVTAVDVVAEKLEPFPAFWIYQRLEIDVSYMFGKKEVMGVLCKWIGVVMMVAIGFVILVKKRFFNYKSNDNKIHSKEMNNYS